MFIWGRVVGFFINTKVWGPELPLGPGALRGALGAADRGPGLPEPGGEAELREGPGAFHVYVHIYIYMYIYECT